MVDIGLMVGEEKLVFFNEVACGPKSRKRTPHQQQRFHILFIVVFLFYLFIFQKERMRLSQRWELGSVGASWKSRGKEII